jgi:hypothetical protein
MSQLTPTTHTLSQLLASYEHQWVALTPDYTHVVASGRSLTETAAQVPAPQRELVIFHKVLPFDAYYEPIQV